MKAYEKERVIELRKQGFSLSDIEKIVPVSRSTISYWTREVQLTDAQKKVLHDRIGKSNSLIAIRTKQAFEARLAKHHEEAEKVFPEFCKNPIFLLGLGIYIGEGSKSLRSDVGVVNSNDRVITCIVSFFSFIGIPKEKLRGKIAIYDDNDCEACIQHWIEVSGLPRQQFNKPVILKSRSNGQGKRKLPYGTCTICASSREYFYKIIHWIGLALDKDFFNL